MQTVNIHQAKTNLSKLIAKTQTGEKVIIAKAGKPVAKLVSYQQAVSELKSSAYKEKLKPRKPGALKGKIFVPDDFNENLNLSISS